MTVLSFEDEPQLGSENPFEFRWKSREFQRHPLAPYLRILTAERFLRRDPVELVHARSDLPGLAALLGRHLPFVWDMRSFWREQRIELGTIRAGSATDRVLQRLESRLAEKAAGIICLSESARRVLEARYGDEVSSKCLIVPTTVDTDRFKPSPPSRIDHKYILLSGTYNGFYDSEAIVLFIEKFRSRLYHPIRWTGATDTSPLWNHVSNLPDVYFERVPFDAMPEIVGGAIFGLSVCHSHNMAPLAAAVPTKIAEFLSSGRPVVVNAGLGDMNEILEKYRCGVVLEGRDEAAIERGVTEMIELLEDPELSRRARDCALAEFDLDQGVAKISQLYESIAASR